jgi:hypothetical protein
LLSKYAAWGYPTSSPSARWSVSALRSRALAVPVLLVPILVLLWAPVLAAQAVALPVVAFSTAGYVHYGSVDFVLGTVQVITNESFDSMKNFLALS